MPIRRIHPPWDYLHDASLPSLESYELSRLNHAANLRREIAALLDQWIEDTAQAMLARWVREDRCLPRGEEISGDESSQSPLPFNELPPGAPPQQIERPVKFLRRNRRISAG